MAELINTQKDDSIETLRGITIILMVAGHVVGGDNTGLKTADDSFLRYVFYVFQFIRMPMFTAIAGYIYASHSIKATGQALPFIKRKFIRLLVPFFSVVSVFYLLKRLVPNINTPAPDLNSIWEVYFLSYEHFWFIQAIFLVFVIVVLLEVYKLILTFKVWAFITIFSFVAFFFISVPTTFFSIDRVFYLLSFFLLGLGLKRFDKLVKSINAHWVLYVIFIISFILQQIIYFEKIVFLEAELKLLSIVVGVSGIATIIYLRPINSQLSKIGFYSFGIYLLHVFATAGSRIVLNTIGIDNELTVFVTGLLAGVSLPIFTQILFAGIPALSVLFFGKKSIKRYSTFSRKPVSHVA